MPTQLRDVHRTTNSMSLIFASLLAAFALVPILIAYRNPFGESSKDEFRRYLIQILFLIRTVSQIIWALYFNNMDIAVKNSIIIAMFNALTDSICAICNHYAHHSFSLDPISQLGLFLFLFGIVAERIPEWQRYIFKSNPKNNGKPHMGGLYSKLVHFNYFGYAIWRFGLFIFARGGLPWTLFFPIFFTYNFLDEIKTQRERNSKKYGQVFDKYWNETYKLIPFVY